MGSTTATCSPGSLQLRLALKCGKCKGSRAVLVRTQMRNLDRVAPRLSVGWRGRVRLVRNGGSWIRSDSAAADAFSGWSESDNAEESTESQRKNWFGGILGAGVAGVVLVAGLTFAAIYISKRSTSRPQQQMEPLMTEQQVSLSSCNVEEKENKGNFVKDSGDLESKTGIDKALSSSLEFNDASIENVLGKDRIRHISGDSDTIESASFLEDLREVSDLSDVSVGTDATPISPKLPESNIVSGSFLASTLKDSDINLDTISPEPTSQIEGNSINVSNLNNDHHEELTGSEGKEHSDLSLDSYSDSNATSIEAVIVGFTVGSGVDTVLEDQVVLRENVETIVSSSTKKILDISKLPQASEERKNSSVEVNDSSESGSSETTSLPVSAHLSANEQDKNGYSEMNQSKSFFESSTPKNYFSPAGIPAPSVVSAALQVMPGKVLIPAVVDPVQGQAIAALQVLKVIEADARPSDLCTRREYARWLITGSSALSRNTVSKVYPAMYIENVTELAFDDITPEDPDFSSIQGLAEAGLISSKLSNRDLLNEDQGPVYFSPESALSRQDLVSWKMALEKRQLPEADRKTLYELSGFIDIDKINPEAWPALVADLSSGEQGIIALAFGCTRLFQPDKPVTKAQAAVALATGEASDMVSEELARIEAESMAENAVSAHNALVAEVEKDINASFEKELTMEREKIDAVEKMAEEAKHELERLRAEREEDRIALMKERVAIESEMEVLSRLRREVEGQLESLMSNKVEISYEKERINKLRIETENESQEIARLQHELEVEQKALSMARAWAEDEAKKAREHAKALEEARDRWERHGIKVVVDNDLQEESAVGVTWLNAGKQLSVEGSVGRAQTLVDKLKAMASNVGENSKEFINRIIERILHLISVLKEWVLRARAKAEELKDNSVLKAKESIQELRQTTAEFSLTVKEGVKRVAGDCREGVEKLTQKFKT
ncbi:hypothetical protein SLEP1_g39883 [Rubroshorea leprosula]|uniref:SLH domain-containing protein n=2 Tax=Rubroshorea leprosula TaxID=152421 RepID=A0AAV5L2G6_9ROSI|nr:hypothetical protein SLEP1_g39883 [Rubroshorea leprosula]